jgi:hypothetical protein
MDASLSQSGNAPASISIQDAPDAIPDVGVSITGGGVNISETVGPGTEALVFELPVGKEHEVEIDTTNFIGRKSFVLPPRGAQVDVQMLEKLFIPDQGGGRIARIDDMEGGNWRTSGSDNPYDLELGPDGRIYVANQSGGFDDVLAFDTIDDPTPDVIDADSFGVQAIGIDHSSRLVYYAGSNDGPYLLRRRIADPTSVDLDLTALISSLFSSYGIWGIAVDDSGAVYASGGAPDAAFAFGGSPRIVKIDPDSGSVLWTRTVNEANNFYGSGQTDVMHNGAGLFVASPRGTDGYKILKLDPATGNTLDHLGTYPDNPDAPDPEELRGPRRFIAVNNRKIHVIDDDGDDFNDARIVGFDNMGGEGWQSYGSYGSSEGQFFFYC